MLCRLIEVYIIKIKLSIEKIYWIRAGLKWIPMRSNSDVKIKEAFTNKRKKAIIIKQNPPIAKKNTILNTILSI